MKLLYSINEAAEILSLSRNSIYKLINTAQLHSVKIGERTLIPAREMEDLVERLLAEVAEVA